MYNEHILYLTKAYFTSLLQLPYSCRMNTFFEKVALFDRAAASHEAVLCRIIFVPGKTFRPERQIPKILVPGHYNRSGHNIFSGHIIIHDSN